MPRHHIFLTLIFATLCLGFAGACSESEPESPVRPVIEGWIDSDGYPIVQFTASFVPGHDEQSLADKVLQFGKVTISDGDTCVTLVGGPLSSYFPPYRYYTYAMTGQPGKTYEIVAEYDGLRARAVCTMPEPTPIDKILFEPIEGSDSLRAASLVFTAPDQCPAYYGVTIRKAERGQRPYPAMMGTVVATRPGERMEVPVFNPKNMLLESGTDFVPQLKIGQEIVVSLCRFTPEVYDFWKGFDEITMFGGSQFVSTSSLTGNIEGGYGIWSAQGTSSHYVVVK